MVTLGHAYGGENGAKNNKAGNQTGRELRFQPWYKSGSGWTHVLRCKDKATRLLIADAMETAVRNKHIGYDQNDRTTLYNAVKGFDFDMGLLTKDAETDCSALVSVCCNYAGIPISKDVYTGNLQAALTRTKLFKCYTSNEYLEHSDHLMRGDILLRAPGHTAVVVNVRYALNRDLYYRKGNILKGNDVKALQERLNSKGYNCGEVDGEFGKNTYRAVVQFQADLGYDTNLGVVDKTTAELLGWIYY